MIADGRKIAETIQDRLKGTMEGKTVGFLMFGENAASRKFVERKSVFAREIGVLAHLHQYPALGEDEILRIVSEFAKSEYNGIVIQLPLPDGINAQKILNIIPVEKDIDMLSEKAKETYQSGELLKVPPVARAVKEILDYYTVSLVHKNVLVIGRGKLVGEPVCMMLDREGLVYSVIDKDTPENIHMDAMGNADIIISGAGSPHLIRPEMIREGVVLIDAGTSEENGKLVGDVDPACDAKAALFTPVPGGVGPVTVASLFLNL